MSLPAQRAIPDLLQLDACALSRAIHARQVSCAEVMNAYLDQIDRLNPKVNAIVSRVDRDELSRQARERDAQLSRGQSMGCMHGFPHAVKDLALTRGLRTTWGSPLLDTVPEEDAIHVERIRSAGAILIGKTNVPEFGLGSQTYNSIFGPTRNPYNLAKTPGGSSGGAAAALALRMRPVADGSDMMGSLRNPAAFTNVFGFRPSFGRVPSRSRDLFFAQLFCEGPMARTVPDAAMLLSVMAGSHPDAPLSLAEDPAVFAGGLERDWQGTRLGWLGDFHGYLPFEPGILDLCRGAFPALQSLGCTVEEAQLDFPPQRIWQAWLTLRHWAIAGERAELYRDPAKRARMKPEMQWEIEGGLKLTAAAVYEAALARSEFYRALLRLFESCDFLLLPSAQAFPFDVTLPWPRSVNGKPMDTYHRWMEVVVLASLSGCPAISVPVGFGPAGLPMGMQIIGRPRSDRSVLQLAHSYDQATQWVAKRFPAGL